MARKSLLLRFDERIHKELRHWASDELRSVNAQIEFLLRQAVMQRRGKDPLADFNPTEADSNPTEADSNPTEADSNPTEEGEDLEA